MNRFLPAVLALLLLGAQYAHAQPSAEQIVERSMQAYTEMMADVESYLMTVDMMGMAHHYYFERIDGAGPLDYRMQLKVPGQPGWHASDDDLPASVSIPTSENFQRLRTAVSFAGEQTLDGTGVYVLQLDDPAAVFDAEAMPADGEFDFDSMTLFVSKDGYMLVGFDAAGTIRANGDASPVTVEMRTSDFRTIGTMRHPFLTEMRIEGLTAGLSDEERGQLEEMRRQMEQMPPEQRQMVEQMMGDQLAQFERMIEGEAMEMNIRVTDLQVNVPRPD